MINNSLNCIQLNRALNIKLTNQTEQQPFKNKFQMRKSNQKSIPPNLINTNENSTSNNNIINFVLKQQCQQQQQQQDQSEQQQLQQQEQPFQFKQDQIQLEKQPFPVVKTEYQSKAVALKSASKSISQSELIQASCSPASSSIEEESDEDEDSQQQINNQYQEQKPQQQLNSQQRSSSQIKLQLQQQQSSSSKQQFQPQTQQQESIQQELQLYNDTEDIVEEGDFLLNDAVETILIDQIKFQQQLFTFQVFWKQRANGVKPKSTIYSYESIKRRYPYRILIFWEDFHRSQLYQYINTIKQENIQNQSEEFYTCNENTPQSYDQNKEQLQLQQQQQNEQQNQQLQLDSSKTDQQNQDNNNNIPGSITTANNSCISECDKVTVKNSTNVPCNPDDYQYDTVITSSENLDDQEKSFQKQNNNQKLDAKLNDIGSYLKQEQIPQYQELHYQENLSMINQNQITNNNNETNLQINANGINNLNIKNIFKDQILQQERAIQEKIQKEQENQMMLMFQNSGNLKNVELTQQQKEFNESYADIPNHLELLQNETSEEYFSQNNNGEQSLDNE